MSLKRIILLFRLHHLKPNDCGFHNKRRLFPRTVSNNCFYSKGMFTARFEITLQIRRMYSYFRLYTSRWLFNTQAGSGAQQLHTQ
jgi:hypothetical protein